MNFPQRKRTRLEGYDYSSPRYYFVTICSFEKKHVFGPCGNASKYGEIAARHISNISSHFEGVRVDKYVVMPNHIHMIVVIGCDDTERSRPFPTLSTIVGQYKSGVSREVHTIAPRLKVWQKSFHDHVIRNHNDYMMIWQYIDTNPATWEKDCFYIDN